MIRYMENLPLRHKLNAIIVSITALTLLLVSIAYFVHQRALLKQQATVELATLSEIYGDTCTAALAFDDRDGAKDLLRSLAAKPTILAAAVLNERGELFASYLSDGAPVQFQEVLSKSEQLVRMMATNDTELFYKKTPIVLDNEVIGTFVILSDFSDVHAEQLRFAMFLSLLFCFALLISLFMSSRFQRHITLPIQSLISTMGNVAQNNDFSLRVQETADDEVGHLCLGFNNMLERI
ncbi:MAG: CHASE sensor domain-containing protein [Desulfuromonas sp.]|nr:CHASE sensor domain-containing protein [Desulfuromonas sp.]